MRVKLLIVYDMAVNLLIGALAGIIIGVLTNIGVDVLVDANVNAFAGVIIAFECAMTDPLEVFPC